MNWQNFSRVILSIIILFAILLFSQSPKNEKNFETNQLYKTEFSGIELSGSFNFFELEEEDAFSIAKAFTPKVSHFLISYIYYSSKDLNSHQNVPLSFLNLPPPSLN
jgi:hypothetical protein